MTQSSMLACLAAAQLLLASAGAASDTAQYAARVSVDAAGQVEAVEILDELQAPLRSLLESASGQLSFEPARSEEETVSSRTTVLFDVKFIPGDAGRQFASVANANAGIAWSKRRIVHWPRGAGRDGYGALVMADLAINPDGSVEPDGSRIESVVLVKEGRIVEEDRYRLMFERATLGSLRRWIAVPEEVNHVPVATRVRVPVKFCQLPRCAGMPPGALAPPVTRQVPRDPHTTLSELKARS